MLRFSQKIIMLFVIAVAANAGEPEKAGSGAEALKYLKKMAKASDEIDYRGKLVFISKSQTKTAELIHKCENGGEYERLKTLDGPHVEIVRINGKLADSGGKGHRASFFDRYTRRPLYGHLSEKMITERLLEVYELSVADGNQVAGRDTSVVKMSPVDQDRYGYNFWIDKQTGLLLKMCLLENKKEIEQFMFVDLEAPADLSNLEEIKNVKIEKNNTRTTSADIALSKNSRWKIDAVPAGFLLTAYEKTKAEPSLEHFIFADGIATFSVYIEKAISKEHYKGAYRFGIFNGYGILHKDYQVMVLGDLPAATIQKIAKSVSAKSE
ncbi:MAG: hypothetical protein D6B27_10655 [Gammaproteobacteria bacterium]|nr:MAG: hypothetical protein D6B27_10655 [Gammaproteobacteria bacterium]